MGYDGQCLACTLFFLQSRKEFLPCRILPEEEDGRCGASPLERRMADCGAGGSRAFPRRFLGARAQAARGGAILPPREAVDLMDGVEQHEAEDLAKAGHRWSQIQGRGVMVLRGVDDGAFDIAQQRIVEVMSARSPAMLLCTAGSAQRAATPSRF